MDLFNSSDFTKHVNQLMNDWHAPGLAVAIMQDQHIASRGYGKASLESEKPVTADTLFDIASSSKSLTAGSVALLVDDDNNYPQVKWDTKMSSLLPDDFVMSEDSYTKDVTVEDILSHRSGLPGHDDSYLGVRSKNPDTPKSVTQNLRNLEIAAPIRTKYMYCNLMFTVATHLVEQLSGLSFGEFLHKHFFKPLGMDSTNLQPDAAIEAGLEDRMAEAYRWDNDEGTYRPVIWQQCPEAQGAGSIFTSVNDYIKWVKALMNKEDPISENIYKGLIRSRTIQDPESGLNEPDYPVSLVLYGAGLEYFYYRGHPVVMHDGLISGFASTHFFLPGFKFGGVILGNSGTAGYVATIIARELIDETLQVRKEERIDWNARMQKEESDNEERRDEETKLGEERCKVSSSSQAMSAPLSAYTGLYYNKGYHHMKVEVKDEQLFIDATDRSMGFTVTFEHLSDQTQFTAHLCDFFEAAVDKVEAEFKFKNEKVVQMGIDLEEQLGKLIWFDKVDDMVLTDQSRGN